MLCHLYLRKGVVYIPTLGKVDKGYYRGIEPVAVVPLSNAEAIRHALLNTVARGNPPTSRLAPGQSYSPITLKYAGVKNWQTFERGTAYWSIKEDSGIFRIIAHRKAEQGWEEDEAQSQLFPAGTPVDEVIDQMISILQAGPQREGAE